MRPGERLPPHRDGIDGICRRRYQIALRSDEGVALTVGGETRRPLPGEAWQIDAARLHSVANESRSDRITILFDTVADRL
jgi:aspartyl/asparaginyl beta-hydroxylase (cupin superfamily)